MDLYADNGIISCCLDIQTLEQLQALSCDVCYVASMSTRANNYWNQLNI